MFGRILYIGIIYEYRVLFLDFNKNGGADLYIIQRTTLKVMAQLLLILVRSSLRKTISFYCQIRPQ